VLTPEAVSAMLCRLAHVRAVAPALGRLINALVNHGESLPYDSDDASLIRVARREYQKTKQTLGSKAHG
jgi:carboxypeptidase Taq